MQSLQLFPDGICQGDDSVSAFLGDAWGEFAEAIV
jgi:hypothetical protein